MTTLTSPITLDPWGKALRFFAQGQVGAGMAILSLGLEAMAERALTGDVRDRLHACARAATAFAFEWSALSTKAAGRHAALLTSRAAWVRCPDCEEWLCLIHLAHTSDAACRCPPIEQWTVDPYTDGRHSRKEHAHGD